MTTKVLFIDALNFDDYPPGGTLNFARQMLAVFGDRLCLVGNVTDDTPVGKWVKKRIGGWTYDFFAIGRSQPIARRPLVPSRLTGYLRLRRHKKEILSLGIDSAFMQSHEVLLAASGWGWKNLCFRFPGVENPLCVSRYPGAKLLGGIFDRLFFPALSHTTLILAAADEDSIHDMVRRSHGHVAPERVVQFPTRVDTLVFRPASRTKERAAVGFSPDATLIVTSGRIHWAKGWKLIIDAFREFRRQRPNSHLFFIGDGQDRLKLKRYAADEGLVGRVHVTGYQNPRQVATYLSAADVFVLGSFKEGWSTVMVEALSCGLPIVSTSVSSARAIVAEGRNGYIVVDRNPIKFAEAMERALALQNAAEFSLSESGKYALHSLGSDLEKLFPPLGA
jgi:glycosyltransferase involved in cell wall biosynthesis